MRPIFILTLLLNALGFLHAQEALLVEVFTYDGCSHCMLANRALRNLENDTALKRAIIILTHHVDYDKQDNFYDSLDHPFSRLRQNELVERGLCSGIFTPQAVLGGKTCFAISGRKQLIDKINSFSLDTAELKAAVNLRKVGAGFSLDVELRNLADTAWQINLVLLQSSRIVSPYSGENAGATLQHSNCLLEAQRFNYREGFSETFQLPQSVLAQPEKFAVLFFLQHKETGLIRKVKSIPLSAIR
jgi:hypothetical protein